MSEAFYVIDGELELQVGDQLLTGRAVTFVLARPNVTHAWRNTSDGDAHVLILFSPPVAYGYFEEPDSMTSAEGGPDPEASLSLAAKYGLG